MTRGPHSALSNDALLALGASAALGMMLMGARCDSEAGTASDASAMTDHRGTCDASACVAKRACDPLASTPAKEITLGPIFAAGRDPDDATLYIVDGTAETVQPRVFVGPEGGALAQRHVTGSGSENNADGTQLVFETFERDSAQLTLAIERAGDKTQMALIPGVEKGTSFDGLSARHALEVLDASSFVGQQALDLGNEVFVEYVAETESHDWLIVTRPENSWSYADFRVFFGARTKLVERKLIGEVSRAKSYSLTVIDFELDGRTATANFSGELSESGFSPGPATLTSNMHSEPLTLHSTDIADLSDVSFTCF